MPKLLLTGPHGLFRSALKTLLSTLGLHVVGDCANGAGAIAAAVRMSHPDVIVMDYDLDAKTSPEALAELLHGAKRAAVLILTAHEDRRAITCALQHGVLGVISKDRSSEVLVRAIGAVASGETWLDRSVVELIYRSDEQDVAAPVDALREKLTRREQEVADLLSLGLQNRKIAERLCISENTVRHHLTSIYNKLGVTNRLELMRYTYAMGGGLAAAS